MCVYVCAVEYGAHAPGGVTVVPKRAHAHTHTQIDMLLGLPRLLEERDGAVCVISVCVRVCVYA